MQRVVRWVFVLWIGCAAMFTAALGYGDTHPQPDQLSKLGFEACNNQPCFMGVTPGLTLWDSVKERLTPFVEGANFEGQAAFYMRNADYSAEGVFGNGK